MGRMRARRASRRRLHREAHDAASSGCDALAAASDTLTADFGTWKTPWGNINRFQRLTDDIVHPFNDAGAEHPGRLHVVALGLARVVRRAGLPGHEEDGTARAATASSRWSSSATACARRRSPRVARAAIRSRRTSTIRRSVRDGQPSRRLLLPVAAEGTHRASVQPW